MNLDNAVTELYQMMVCDTTSDPEDRYVFLQQNGRPNIRAKEIGIALWKVGGTNLMHDVVRKLHEKTSHVFYMSVYLRQLEFCWNGIGEWQA